MAVMGDKWETMLLLGDQSSHVILFNFILFLFLFIYLFIHLFIYLFIYLFTYLFIYLEVMDQNCHSTYTYDGFRELKLL